MADAIIPPQAGVKGRTTLDLTARRRLGNRVTYGVFAACALALVLFIAAIIVFVSSKGLTTFIKDRVSITQFLFSTVWQPDAQPGTFGAATFIVGSLEVTLLAILISTPLSIAAALFLTDVGPKWAQRVLQPAVELFVGIPSVVYGWVGLSLLVPFIRTRVGGLGFSLLAGCVVLSIMALPTITTVATDSLRALPIGLKEASYGLGATRWQTIARVLLPAALPGLMTAVILGMARAIGEALAVQMVIGNTEIIPKHLTDRAATLTSIITLDMGNTVGGTAWNNSLWSMAMLLLLIALGLILTIRVVSARKVYA
ncbi:MAG: phosphate ABC transporter permease subunit PstC [Thermomicrobia bacterium]|nr:phosphate ABC transporter permease subunit PstC [Thermomicrobia bacterium]